VIDQSIDHTVVTCDKRPAAGEKQQKLKPNKTFNYRNKNEMNIE